jgi:hypothetical protein
LSSDDQDYLGLELDGEEDVLPHETRLDSKLVVLDRDLEALLAENERLHAEIRAQELRLSERAAAGQESAQQFPRGDDIDGIITASLLERSSSFSASLLEEGGRDADKEHEEALRKERREGRRGTGRLEENAEQRWPRLPHLPHALMMDRPHMSPARVPRQNIKQGKRLES